ncbi:hypothetical protein GCM10009807_32920 [Microbacterium lacus]|uniref:Uncharacterized protein n=1 Tax=Microbacterium lacus TaxID=415217 RepID=A0ABN2HEN7_9MICO
MAHSRGFQHSAETVGPFRDKLREPGRLQWSVYWNSAKSFRPRELVIVMNAMREGARGAEEKQVDFVDDVLSRGDNHSEMKGVMLPAG